jgi:hypothetical protein
MKLDSKKKAKIGIIAGLVLGLCSCVFSFGAEPLFIFCVAFYLAASLFSIWGCTHYALSKGLPDWLGCVGIVSIFGFALIFFLPDRSRSRT